MTSDKLPADSTASDVDTATDNSQSKVLKFDESNCAAPAQDINTKITALDTNLAHLRVKLGAINSSVEEGLDRLGDTDTDLTAKVSETYKRLGEIDNAYKSLIEISSRIDSDIQKLNGDVDTVAQQSASGIKTLEQSTIAQSNEFSQKNQQVVTRVNHLLETSKLTGDLLTQKIQATTEKMLQMEQRIVAEIESLASASKDKADTIEVSVERNKAKILKLQSVDEAIIKRATTLEISSAELTVKTQDMQMSVEQLQLSSSRLSDGLTALREQIRALEDVSNNHGSLINSLQKTTSDLKHKFSRLANRESRRFSFIAAALVVLVFATAVIYFTQQSQFDTNETEQAAQAVLLENKLSSLQQTQQDSVISVNDSLSELESKIAQANTALQDKLKQQAVQINNKVQAVNDHLQSVDARLSLSSPFSLIGDDNVIHGAQWISALPAENFVVQLAFVDKAETMYEIAQRYNHYLKDVLSYFKVNDNGVMKYVLLSGNYTTQRQAMIQMQRMPRYLVKQKPVVKPLVDVQTYIAQSGNL